MTRKGDQALAKVEHYAAEREAARRAEHVAVTKLHEWMRKAVTAGVSSTEVARVAGVSKGRVSQIAPVPKPVDTPVHAQKKDAEPVRDADADTLRSIPDTSGGTLSGLASTRNRKPYGLPTGRVTAFYDPRNGQLVTETGDAPNIARHPGRSVNSVLQAVELSRDELGDNCRVFLVGPPPIDTSTGATMAEAVRAWAIAGVDPDWGTVNGWKPGAHYLEYADLPTLRFDKGGRRVTIMRAATWWGESDADAATCAAAWRGLGKQLDAAPAFAGAGLADTPATTGRALWLRTIPEGRSYPVLSAELRELIAATSGQGRIELRPDPFGAKGARGQDFTILDGRFMYAALTWGMPVGEPTMWTGGDVLGLPAAELERTMRGRGRWKVGVTVPRDWRHVGILMAPDSGRAWRYPRKPGETFTTWADGSEVWTAMQHGWHVEIHEGMTWAEGKPLDTWRDALVKVWETCRASESEAAQLAARAVRSILLFALGAFAARTHMVSRSAPVDQAPEIPAGTEVRVVGDSLVWTEAAPQSDWTVSLAHPEWSATVWARARMRLLDAPGAEGQRVGALSLDPSRVVGFATDALYLAGGEPGWADDGKPGRFRVKGTRPGPFAWPSSYAELYRLRDEAQQ